MIRRLVVTGMACAALASVIPATGASAAVEVQINGQLVSSNTVSNQDVYVRLCPTAGGISCVTPAIDGSGAFSTALTPDEWDVVVSTKQSVTSFWTATTQTELLDSASWTLQLPELSRVSLRVRDADGAPMQGASVDGGSDRVANPLDLSPDLPAFEAENGINGPTTDAEGRSVFHVLPDADREIRITGYQDGLEYRVPLVTPNQTSVDATSDVSVRAKALPIHNVSFRVEDYAGRQVNTNGYNVTGPWGQFHGQVPATGPATFSFPEGEASLRLYSGAKVWYLPSSWYLDQPLSITGSDAFTMTLPQPVRTRANVRDADTGDVAEGVRVQVGGSADPAALAAGLAPAQLVNGSFRGLRATSNADGGVEFRTFPDATLTASATLQGPGLYRTAPERDVDASTDNDFTIRLPKSVVIDIDATDADGAQLEDARAGLRIASEFILPFADGPDGRPQMRITPGPAAVEVNLGNPSIALKRDAVVTVNTTFEYQSPELVEVTVVALDWRGAVVPDVPVNTSGRTQVETDAGPIMAQFSSVASLTNAQGVGVVMSPPSKFASVNALSPVYAGADGVTLTEERTVIVQAQNQQIGAGLPYTLFDAVDPLMLDADGTLSWRPVDASFAQFTRHVHSPLGVQSVDTNFIAWFGGGVNPLPVRYPSGATTCIDGLAQRSDGETLRSPQVCRTRPIDDDDFTRVGSWQRVSDAAAYGNSYVTTNARRTSLMLKGLDMPSGHRPGEVSLLAYTSPNAGEVRLRIRDQWVSDPLSLQGPAQDEPTVLEVPIKGRFDTAAFRGMLEVVVVSDGQRVRLDGLAWPVPTMPEPFLPPL